MSMVMRMSHAKCTENSFYHNTFRKTNTTFYNMNNINFHILNYPNGKIIFDDMVNGFNYNYFIATLLLRHPLLGVNTTRQFITTGSATAYQETKKPYTVP